MLRAIVELNKAYAPAGVQFLWDAEADFAIVKNSYLNRDFDPTTDATILSPIWSETTFSQCRAALRSVLEGKSNVSWQNTCIYGAWY